MSDMSQGPGWWIASDGKWYPPESHPDRRVDPGPSPEPDPVVAPSSSPPLSESEPETPASRWLGREPLTPRAVDPPSDTLASDPSPLSDPSLGSDPSVSSDPSPAGPSSSRWLGRNPRPPVTPPVGPVEGAEPETPPAPTGRWPSPPVMPTVVAPPPVELGPSAPTTPVRATRSAGPWVLAAAAVVALAVASLVVALVAGGGGGRSTLATGSETATIHIRAPQSGAPSFSGTVGGLALTGSTTTDVTESPNTGVLGSVVFVYKGRLGGTPYVLHVSLESVGSNQELEGGPVVFAVTGTYGSQRVTANAEFVVPSAGSGSSSPTVSFDGELGRQLVQGSATARQTTDGTIDVTATFRVESVPVSVSLP